MINDRVADIKNIMRIVLKTWNNLLLAVVHQPPSQSVEGKEDKDGGIWQTIELLLSIQLPSYYTTYNEKAEKINNRIPRER